MKKQHKDGVTSVAGVTNSESIENSKAFNESNLLPLSNEQGVSGVAVTPVTEPDSFGVTERCAEKPNVVASTVQLSRQSRMSPASSSDSNLNQNSGQGNGSGSGLFENEIMKVREVAKLLKVSSKTVYKMAGRGEIPCRKIGNQLRFLRSEVIAWMKGV